MMRYLLLLVLVVSLVGVLVIPDVYSDTHYNINEGTIVDYKVDSTCEFEASDSSKAEYETRFGGTGTWKYVDQKMVFDGVQLENYMKSSACHKSVQFIFLGDRYFWDTISTISVTVGSSSSDGATLELEGMEVIGFNSYASATMKNGTVQDKDAFIDFGEDWKYAIPSNSEVGDKIGVLKFTDGAQPPVIITDSKIMTVGGTSYTILVAMAASGYTNSIDYHNPYNGCGEKHQKSFDSFCKKWFYEKTTGMLVGLEDTYTSHWNIGSGAFATASTSIMFTKITKGIPPAEPLAPEVSTVKSASGLPPGVKSPAPNFEKVFEWADGWDEEPGLTISELYANWSQKSSSLNTKIVSGDGKDLLVWMSIYDGTEMEEPFTTFPQEFSMYDGKDRKFTPITSSDLTWSGEIENPNFSWSEVCSPLSVTVQPGIVGEMEICFEIPKDSDHFKFVYTEPEGYKFVVEIFDRQDISNAASNGSQSGGGCLIATAAFGSEMAPQVQFLRELRDNTVLQTESGTSFMTGFNQFYYSFSPYIADYERENPAFKETVKLALTPLLTSLTLLQYVDIDSESEMLGYGIGVILLNIGMYFVAPAVLIMAVRKRI